jgi:hypothetical protein
MRSGLTTVPLQSRPNASPFWIMLLLSSTAFGHGMIDADQTRSKKRSFATTFLSSSPACPARQSGLHQLSAHRASQDDPVRERKSSLSKSGNTSARVSEYPSGAETPPE